MQSVSVILPVYNALDTVRAAVESLESDALHAADPGSVEVITVDDGSTDGSAELLDTMAASAPWLRVMHIPHGGIVAALNAGLAAAQGAFIARMDADDVSLSGRLVHQMEYLAAHPEIGLVSGQVEFGGDRKSARGYALHVDWLNALHTPEEIMLERFVESPFAHPSVMFRRELVARHGGYREGDFPEDYELWLRWMDAGVRMARMDVPVLRWNDSPHRISRSDPRYSVDAFYAVKARYLARRLERENPHHPGVIVWGSGRITRRRIRLLEREGVEVRAWVDIDPGKIGQMIGGVNVISPDQLPPPGSCFILTYVGSRGARGEIANWLDAHGYSKGLDYLHAA
jgi:glycosyltransferase involved in cell wall biosynthesis